MRSAIEPVNSLLIGALIGTCVLLVGFQSNNQAQKHQAQTTKTSKPAPSSPSVNQPTKENAGSGGGTEEQKQEHKMTVVSVPEVRVEQRKDIIDWLMLACTVILTVVGVAGTCLALQTLRAIQTEVKTAVIALRHSNRLANAAKLSAITAERHTATLKNTYRAWVLTRWSSGTMAEKFSLYFHNYGPTPAQIVSRHFRKTVIAKTNLTSLTGIDYGENLVSSPEMIAPGEERLIESVDGNQVAQNHGEWPAVAGGSMVVVCYGIIKYRDVLDADFLHETAFLYWYSPKEIGLHFGGPSEYHNTT